MPYIIDLWMMAKLKSRIPVVPINPLPRSRNRAHIVSFRGVRKPISTWAGNCITPERVREKQGPQKAETCPFPSLLPRLIPYPLCSSLRISVTRWQNLIPFHVFILSTSLDHIIRKARYILHTYEKQLIMNDRFSVGLTLPIFSTW